MHSVCDEHGSHSFKSDGWLARRPGMQEVILDQEKEYQQAELGGHQHVNARGILARTPCQHCPHSVSFEFPSGQQCRGGFEDRKAGQTWITLADGREWKCMHNICISCSNSWLLCSISSLSMSLPCTQHHLNANDGLLNEVWSLRTMHMCTFGAQLKSA